MKFIISLYIFLIIFFIIECYDRQPWTLERKSGEIKIDENNLIVKVGKTIYTAVGYFSKSAKPSYKLKKIVANPEEVRKIYTIFKRV